MRMWEIRERDRANHESEYDEKAVEDAYECGYEDGYADAMKTVEGWKSSRSRKNYR